MKKFNPKDDQLIRNSFEKFVRNHPGKYVAVADGKIVFAKTRAEVEKLIAAKSETPPSVMQIPHEKSLICAL